VSDTPILTSEPTERRLAPRMRGSDRRERQ